MHKQRSENLWAALAVVAGALLRGFFLYKHARFGGDTLVYGDIATNMLTHHVYGFTQPGGPVPTLIRLPGYPLFLALCFKLFGMANYLAVDAVQIVLDLGGCVLLSVLAGRLMGRRTAMAVLWLAALCPFTANYAAAPLTETGSLFCVVLAFFALERWMTALRARAHAMRWALLIGLALLGAVLLRPEQGLLAAAVVPAMLWFGWKQAAGAMLQRALPAVVASLVIVLTLLGWAGRNWRVFHVVQPLAPKSASDPGELVPYGFQRWYRTWGIEFKSTVDVYWNYDGSSIAMKDIPPRAFDSEAQRAQMQQLLAEYNQVDSATPGFDDAFAAIAARRVAQHPVRYYVLLPLAREANMWLRPRTELMRLPVDWWNVRAHAWASVKELAYAALNLAFLVLGAVGFARWRRGGWSGQPTLAYAMAGFILLRCLLLLTLDNSEPRYTLECFPLILLFGGFALGREYRIVSD